ncbi:MULTISPECIES: ROK family transcriptional regulator [unclassified Rathayibacter]|uniref:ROK family transcriptional regulator n=4 Tax=Rathayibacter TaxID=33886 RepID=UPI000CE90AE1|nr:MULTISPECIES: ROK family transcriptional regulator [unclassified Rathayibacter]PPF41671.1 transcriptional regulator [Rathayibacter sp. AY1A1]PPG74549.1 transcriptional regulator [Rathayibacter sp. AY1E5]PPG80489.1 transcriptional regulator [Rathayibacter sp. AY1H2]PPH26204.1 transcriptional regulator [Rathayibacter sp. AY1C3]
MPDHATRGNNLDRVRRHNLSAILRLVHRGGPRSRSQLTRLTGLNRSTIAALVGELVELGIVREREPATPNQVGRPSPVVEADPGVVALAVNPEIDAVTVAVVGVDAVVRRRIRRSASVPTAEAAARLAAEAVAELLAELPEETRTVGIGVAVPGLVRDADGLVRVGPHLGWDDEPFSRMLADATGLPVLSANDANLGALAESVLGAGRDVSHLVYLNGGASGVGAGVIVGGAPLHGIDGYAGEIGHTLVNSAGIDCHCGAVGCLETEVGRAELLTVLGLDESERLEEALAASEDPAVRAEVERQLGHLAVALRNVINVFNPQLVVLGGFLGALVGVAPGFLEERLGRGGPFRVALDSVRIVRTELGADLLMLGAAELAFERLLADPLGTPLHPV